MIAGFRIVICTLEDEAHNTRQLCNIEHRNAETRDSFDIINAGSNDAALNADHTLMTGNTYRSLLPLLTLQSEKRRIVDGSCPNSYA